MSGPETGPRDPSKKEPPLLPPDVDLPTFGVFGPPVTQSRLQRRRNKIIEEIARNRRGEYKVPTWVLVLCLVLFVGAWAAWIIFAG